MSAGVDRDDDAVEGWGLVRASWWLTGLFVVTSMLAVAVEPFRVVAAIIDLALFVIGVGVFLAAFFRAVGRSRTEVISVGGLYFLAGCAPAGVRRHLMGALAVQVVVALVAASLAPFTSVAFGILVPVLGLGMAGWWGARYGEFPPRAVEAAE